MSFLTTIETDASQVEQAVVSGLKDAVGYVDNVVVTDILPALGQALVQALEKFGSDVLTALLGELTTNGTATASASNSGKAAS